MTKLFLLSGTLLLAACKPAEAPPPADTTAADNAAMEANMMDANMGMDANMAAPMATASLNQTSWEFTDAKSGKAMQESIDANGKYITQSGKEHIDHGTAAMKDGKACFTSAMTKDGEMCWTDPMLAEGQSGETTNDKGEKLTVKRVAYVPLTM